MNDEIRASLKEFQRIDAAYRRFVAAKDYAGAAGTLARAAHLYEKLRYLLSRRGAVAGVDAGGAEALRRFRDREFSIQETISRLSVEADYGAEDWPPEGRWVPDDHLNLVLDPEAPSLDFVIERLLECQVVISLHRVPAWVQKRMLTVRRCYALELYDATWVFLRAVIEAASYDWLADHGRVKPTGPVRLLSQRQQLGEWLGDALDGAQVPASLQGRIRAVVRRANDIVHSKSEPAEPNGAETLKAVRDVVEYLERLYT